MGSIAAPVYATTADLDFNGILETVIPIDAGQGSPVVTLFIPWDGLSTPDQQEILSLLADYGADAVVGSPQTLPIPATAGFQKVQLTADAVAAYVTKGQDETNFAEGSPIGPTGSFDGGAGSVTGTGDIFTMSNGLRVIVDTNAGSPITVTEFTIVGSPGTVPQVEGSAGQVLTVSSCSAGEGGCGGSGFEITLGTSNLTDFSAGTGLDTDRTYTVVVQYISGSPQETSEDTATFAGSEAQTFADLVTQLNLGFAVLIASLDGDENLRFTNSFDGRGFNVEIDDAQSNLFPFLNGFNGFCVPRNGVSSTRDVFRDNRIEGTPARFKFPFVLLGARPVNAPGNDLQKAYFKTAGSPTGLFVRLIDDVPI